MTDLKPKTISSIELSPEVKIELAEADKASREIAKTFSEALAGLNRHNNLPKPFEGIRMGLPSIAKQPTKPTNIATITKPNHLGDLVKSSRKSKKITQQQLADLAGVGRRFIVECEAGKPRLEFAKVLQVVAAAGIDIIAIKR
jgi:y4mF family transcriptional regulator